MRRYCASAKSLRRPRGGVADALRGDLLGGERLARAGLGRGVALVELGRSEGAAVGEEAVDLARAPGKRLAQHRGATLFSRALAGVGAAVPDDVTGDDALC